VSELWQNESDFKLSLHTKLRVNQQRDGLIVFRRTWWQAPL